MYVPFSRAERKIVHQQKLSLWTHTIWLKVQGLEASEPTDMRGSVGVGLGGVPGASKALAVRKEEKGDCTGLCFSNRH